MSDRAANCSLTLASQAAGAASRAIKGWRAFGAALRDRVRLLAGSARQLAALRRALGDVAIRAQAARLGAIRRRILAKRTRFARGLTGLRLLLARRARNAALLRWQRLRSPRRTGLTLRAAVLRRVGAGRTSRAAARRKAGRKRALRTQTVRESRLKHTNQRLRSPACQRAVFEIELARRALNAERGTNQRYEIANTRTSSVSQEALRTCLWCKC